jgi:general secretion pathway protein M
MQLLPSPERGRFMAVALLLAVLAIGYFGGVHWWFTARHLEIAGEMADLREQELRFRRTADERPTVESRLAEVRQFEAGNPAFLTEMDFDSAAAGLTQRLKQIVSEHARDAQSC